MPLPLEFYDKLAGVYEHRDHLDVARAFFARLSGELDALEEGAPVLDLACGSGVLSELVLARGLRVLGVDLSKPMLARARKRCARFGRRARFLRGDLRRFRAPRPAACAAASGDIVNHLPRRSLRPVFRNVGRNLRAGGFLAFEAHRRFCYEEYWSERTYHMETEGGDLVMECDWDGERELATARMIGYLRERGGSYRKVEATLREHYHPERELRAALREAGFKGIRHEPWSPWSDQHLEPDIDRTWWIARRPGT